MLMSCDNKGCMKTTNVLIRVETKEVVCTECGEVIVNVSEPMKRVLISEGHILRTEEKKAFTMGCRSCNANRQVVLDINDNTVCKVCMNPINVHPAMRQAILEVGERLTVKETKAVKKKAKKVKKKVKK